MNIENVKELIRATEADQESQSHLDKKLNTAKKMLYGVVAAQCAAMVFGFVGLMKINQQMKGAVGVLSDISTFSAFDSISFFPAFTIVVAILTLRELQSQNVWGWVASIFVFLIAVPSWSLPFSILGLLSILDVQVRTRFLKQLDINI